MSGAREFWSWCSEALTVFINGAMAGIGAGGAAGGGAAATTETSDLSVISFHALVGLVLGMIGNGIRRFVIWHHSHEMPNPFRNSATQTPTAETSQAST